MKTITIPEPIAILDTNGNNVVKNDDALVLTFKQFVEETLLIDAKFGKSMAHILAAVEIKNALKTADEKLELDTATWEKLKEVAEEPTNNYNPVVVVQLVSFLLAIRDAK